MLVMDDIVRWGADNVRKTKSIIRLLGLWTCVINSTFVEGKGAADWVQPCGQWFSFAYRMKPNKLWTWNSGEFSWLAIVNTVIHQGVRDHCFLSTHVEPSQISSDVSVSLAGFNLYLQTKECSLPSIHQPLQYPKMHPEENSGWRKKGILALDS